MVGLAKEGTLRAPQTSNIRVVYLIKLCVEPFLFLNAVSAAAGGIRLS